MVLRRVTNEKNERVHFEELVNCFVERMDGFRIPLLYGQKEEVLEEFKTMLRDLASRTYEMELRGGVTAIGREQQTCGVQTNGKLSIESTTRRNAGRKRMRLLM